MALAPQYVEEKRYTEAEYFEIERTAFGRWEYVGGQVRLMSGGTTDHGAIASNVVRLLGNALVPRGCRVYGSAVKIHTGDGVNTFPDVSVVCGEHHYYSGRKDVVLNPLLVVEVLSPSTEGYDRGEKFDHYQNIESLQEYLLVEQDEPRVLLYTRREDRWEMREDRWEMREDRWEMREDRWEMREARGREKSISLPSVGVTLALADIYALVEFGAETP